ncbi:hypothetical protein [Collimonas sp. OK607]|uniref:hypothetical protein n=1 Tax=Collimonas sp. OK607 TaxID=1798194 RepID=UPI00147B6251|nr:hypothetical protein [Collimonas sp. OK607]
MGRSHIFLSPSCFHIGDVAAPATAGAMLTVCLPLPAVLTVVAVPPSLTMPAAQENPDVPRHKLISSANGFLHAIFVNPARLLTADAAHCPHFPMHYFLDIHRMGEILRGNMTSGQLESSLLVENWQ